MRMESRDLKDAIYAVEQNARAILVGMRQWQRGEPIDSRIVLKRRMRKSALTANPGPDGIIEGCCGSEGLQQGEGPIRRLTTGRDVLETQKRLARYLRYLRGRV